MALYHSSLRRFEDSTCMASSRGPPSSLIKHGSKVSFLAFLAHSCLSPLTSGLFQGRVHDPGRRTKDGFSAFHALLGGRLTANVSPRSSAPHGDYLSVFKCKPCSQQISSFTVKMPSPDYSGCFAAYYFNKGLSVSSDFRCDNEDAPEGQSEFF